MGDILQHRDQLNDIEEHELHKRKAKMIDEMVCKLQGMELQEVAYVNRLLVHREDFKTFFELQKILQRQIG